MSPNEDDEQARLLVESAPCQVVLPAGCGKTQLAANAAAVVVRRGGRVLVLTHTHAAVDAVRSRLRFLGISNEQANVATIAAWFGRLVKAYPMLSGVVIGDEVDFDAVDAGALQLFANSHILRMLAASYDLLIVDEYQDCNVGQHAAIAAVRDVIPTVVLGDPLQAVLDYRGNTLVDWDADLADVPRLELEVLPWRWAGANEPLGAFTLEFRAALLSGQAFDLASAPVEWLASSDENVRKAMFASRKFDGTTVVLSGAVRAQALSAAKQVGGLFGLMEEVEGKQLLKFAGTFDGADGFKTAAAAVEFAAGCFCGMSPLKTKCKDVADGTFPAFRQGGVLTDALTALKALTDDPTTSNLLSAMDAMSEVPDAKLVCREAWYGVKEAALIQSRDAELSLTEAVQRVRDRARRYGRYREGRVVSRVPLYKGQQCGRCIAVLQGNMKTPELYVALTRATQELVVISASAVIGP
jgi:hypothetical protein